MSATVWLRYVSHVATGLFGSAMRALHLGVSHEGVLELPVTRPIRTAEEQGHRSAGGSRRHADQRAVTFSAPCSGRDRILS